MSAQRPGKVTHEDKAKCLKTFGSTALAPVRPVRSEAQQAGGDRRSEEPNDLKNPPSLLGGVGQLT